MNIRRKKLKYLVLILSSLILLIPSRVSADSDEYDLGIDENTEITWKFTRVNEEKLEEFLDKYETNILAMDYDYEKGEEVKYKLTSIEDEEDYYRLYFDVYEDDEQIGYTRAKIAKDPEDLAADLFDDTGQTDFTYDFLFTLTKTRDYIKEFGTAIPEIYNLFVGVSYRSIIIDSTAVGLEDIIVFQYDDDGILEEFKIYYQGYLILVIKLHDVTKNEYNLYIFPIIITIVIIVAANIVIAVVLIVMHKKKKEIEDRAIAPKKEVFSAEVPKESIQPVIIDKSTIYLDEIKYCENCGTKRKGNNKFCTNCGNKY